jgi:tetratricopeptide (TPR) repeat protein
LAAIRGFLDHLETVPNGVRLINRAYPYWYKTLRLSQAFSVSSQALESVGAEDSDELVELLFRSGSAAHSLFKLPEAADLLQRAEAMADRLELESWSTESLRFRGELASDRGRIEEAQALITEALGRCQLAGDQVATASCLGTLGYIARQARDLDESKRLTTQAMALYTAIGDSSGRLWCLGSLGALLIEMGDHSGAAAALSEALADHRRSGNLRAQAWNLAMLGEVAVRANDPQAALRYVDEALSIHTTEEQGLMRIWPLRVRGEALRLAGKLTEAEEALQETLSLSRASGATSQEAYALIRLSMLKFSVQDHLSARAYHDAAKIIAAKADVAELARELELNEARIEAAS